MSFCVTRGAVAAFGFGAFDHFDAAVKTGNDVPIVEKAFFSNPISTKARLEAIFQIAYLPLKMLPTRRSSVLRSMVNSSRRPFSWTAMRVSRTPH